jgi:hypothetical protein
MHPTSSMAVGQLGLFEPRQSRPHRDPASARQLAHPRATDQGPVCVTAMQKLSKDVLIMSQGQQ